MLLFVSVPKIQLALLNLNCKQLIHCGVLHIQCGLFRHSGHFAVDAVIFYQVCVFFVSVCSVLLRSRQEKKRITAHTTNYSFFTVMV